MKYLLAIILLFTSLQVFSNGFITGNILLLRCEDYLNKTNIATGNTCVGFIMGIDDAHAAFVGWKYFTDRHCTPDKIHTD